MPATITEILGYTSLLEAIDVIKKGLPDELPPEFSNITEQTLGNTARYIQFTGQRRTAKVSGYGAAAHKRQMVDIGKRDMMLLHSFEEINFDPIVLQNLMQYQNYEVQNMGRMEVARQIENFTTLFVNLRTTLKLMVLKNAIVYFDGEGNLLPTSSGAVLTVDFGRNANNANQLNGLIAQSWDNNNANIPLQITNIQAQAAKDHGYIPEIALYGKNVRGYIAQNNYMQGYLARDPMMNHQFNTQLGLPKGLLGLEWYPIHRAFYNDQNDTAQDVWNADAVVFCPRPEKKWWSIIEGSYPVPTNTNIISDAEAAMQSVVLKHGMFGFSRLIINPSTVAIYMGDTMMPVMKNPNVTYSAVVKF